MKEVIIDKFDGVVMSAVVGHRIELDESKAISIVNAIAAREAAAADKVARSESLRVEMELLKNELAADAPALEADIADAKALIKKLIDCYVERGITAPNVLIAFAGVTIDAPPVVDTVTL